MNKEKNDNNNNDNDNNNNNNTDNENTDNENEITPEFSHPEKKALDQLIKEFSLLKVKSKKERFDRIKYIYS
ncbi:MAG: hypothetical protein GF317_09855 [Candidatus Lokiarchaeota archaeon]|nr:hypothetical protein [Candidatus Lokiarchaeota archaeon]